MHSSEDLDGELVLATYVVIGFRNLIWKGMQKGWMFSASPKDKNLALMSEDFVDSFLDLINVIELAV